VRSPLVGHGWDHGTTVLPRAATDSSGLATLAGDSPSDLQGRVFVYGRTVAVFQRLQAVDVGLPVKGFRLDAEEPRLDEFLETPVCLAGASAEDPGEVVGG